MKHCFNLHTCVMLSLLALVGIAAVSCGDSAVSVAETTAAVSEMAVTETEEVNERASVKDSLPDDLDFNGRTFTVFVPNSSDQNDYFGGPDAETGEIVDDAVIDRNRKVEERLNIELVYQPNGDTNWDKTTGIINTYLMSGDTTIDLFMGEEYAITQSIVKGGFINANELQYIDFSQPWWNNTYMDQLEIGSGVRYLLVGDFFISVLQCTHVLYYNKSMYGRYYDNADGLYEMVLDGTWTIDKLSEICRDVYVDVDNDGAASDGDQLGYVTYLAAASVDPFMYCGEVEYTSKDEDGLVTITMLSDRAVTLCEKVVGFFNQEGNRYTWDNSTTSSTDMFVNGHAMFLGINTLSSAKSFRDMQDDFGFLPYPKLDEAQENYHSVVADIGLLGAIPGTSLNTDIAGAVIEALNAETYRTVTPAWYEEALKIKYTRDYLSAQIIDIIHDASYANFIFAYSSSLNNIGTIMRNLVSANKTDYASTVQKQEKAVQKRLEKIVTTFEEMQD